jgi:flavin reductase (DIM6/NTAB) family NADH-FMN oxidoreductase RutF
MPLSKDQFRKIMGKFATGVTVITVYRDAAHDGPVHGMTANAFCSVSLEPMLVLVCVDHKARMRGLLYDRMRFGVSILGENQQPVSDLFARPEQDPDTAARLGVSFQRTARGTPLLAGCLATLECRVVAAHEAGDHTVFIGEVEEGTMNDGRPLLFASGRYTRLA